MVQKANMCDQSHVTLDSNNNIQRTMKNKHKKESILNPIWFSEQ